MQILIRNLHPLLSVSNVAETDALVATIALVASLWPILLDIMERQSIVLHIVEVMRRFRHSAPIIARCMTALRAFAVTDSMRKRLMFDGAMDLTLEFMSLYKKQRRIQDRAAAIIANVAFGCTHRKRRIVRHGAIRRIIDAMAAFPCDDNIQLRGALAIRNLTYEAQVNQYIAGNEGAVDAIAASLIRFRGASINPELRCQCVMALESLCKDDERNRQRIIDIDETGMSFPNNSSIPSLAFSKPSEEDEEENLNEHGDVVVDEEQLLASDVSVNFRHGQALCPGRTSSKLLGSTSMSSSACSERIARISVSDENKSEQGDHSSPEKVSKDCEDKPSKKKPSILRAILHTMRRDPDDPLLLDTCLSLLTLVALHRGEVQARLGELDTIRVAIAAISKHPESVSIAAKACALIRCLCLQECNRSRVTSGLVVLISVAKGHCRNADVVREVASALSNAVFEHEKNRAWVVSKGGVNAIVRAMDESGEKDVMVLEAGICALRNFVDSSYNGALLAASEGAIKSAVSALDRTKDASSTGECIVQEQAVLFLVDVAHLAPQTQNEMEEIDAADWIENALAKLPISKYAEIHVSGDKLINLLVEVDGKFQKSKKGSVGNLPPSPTTISAKPHSKGIFSGFLLSKRSPKKNSGVRRKRRVGRNTPNEVDSRRRSKRISPRDINQSSMSS